MIETIITICALTLISPFYDCDETWDIIIWDKTHEKVPNTEHAIGTALYTEFGNEIELVYNHQTTTGVHDHMMKGGGVLWHEILHLYCECNWHKYWDTEDEQQRKHRFSKAEFVLPDEIKPFIKSKYHVR